jgi:hypothetical protein
MPLRRSSTFPVFRSADTSKRRNPAIRANCRHENRTELDGAAELPLAQSMKCRDGYDCRWPFPLVARSSR